MDDAPSRPPVPARRILALWLPHLPTDRIARQDRLLSSREGKGSADRAPLSPQPLAVVARVKSALRLVALNHAAERLGLARGMALADARAMIPTLAVADADDAADMALLDAVADWAERYTPLVALDETQPLAGHEHGLMLDITGCAHLFGGEAALAGDLVMRLKRQGFAARVAIADTAGAASAVARFGSEAIVAVPPGGMAERLAPLPLAALRLDPETVAALDRVGLKRIGQIMDAPRAPLAARFGAVLMRRLDQALGDEEEAINPRRPAPSMLAERRFGEPIALEEDIAATLAALAETLARTLETRGLGARALELTLFRVDGAVARIAVSAARPLNTAKRVLALFREKFVSLGAEIDAGYGFDMARLAATETAPLGASQVDLAGDAGAEADLDELIDRIGARLGAQAVNRITPGDSHIPERAEGLARYADAGASPQALLLAGGGGTGDMMAETVLRPLRLFARPEPVEAVAEVPDGPPVRFRWRRALYRIARAEGPERIAAEWWRDDDLTRDYFRVEDAGGHRFWLFREGLYGRETVAPRWYVHGVFA